MQHDGGSAAQTVVVERWRIPVPLPLKWVNVYRLGPEEGPWILVDAGMDTPEARAAFEDVFREWPPDRFVGLFLTHYHPDHTGLSGWLAERLGVPAYMLSAERDLLYQVFSGQVRSERQAHQYFRENGMPDDLLASPGERRSESGWLVRLPPSMEGVENGHRWRLGNEEWTVVLAPGHTPAQGLLYHAPSGTLLTGDHILPRITPNISLWPGQASDPLADYLASLADLSELPLRVGWPAHGEVIADPLARIAEIRRHHDQRLETMAAALQAGPLTAYEVARAVFRPDLSRYEWRFAVGETLAHLRYLARRGRVAEIPGPPHRYRLVT
jgi:glyoxylase-like metal-dependent hydrolase (beta-lactamase superfamily II)